MNIDVFEPLAADTSLNLVTKAMHEGRVFGMGRVVVPDPRDRAFGMAAVTPKSATVSSRLWQAGPVLDQGSTPHCVAFAWGQFLQTEPIATSLKRLGGGAFLTRLYKSAREAVAVAGAGASVRGGAQAVQHDGRLASYVWGYDVDTIRRFVLSVGPVVMGTDWYSGMFSPESNVLRPTGAIVGGHAWTIVGYDANRDAFRMVNSWGEQWGDNGFAWITSGDLRTLMQNGEACSAVECEPAEPGPLDTPARKRKPATKPAAKPKKAAK